jgi:hypothetical protein
LALHLIQAGFRGDRIVLQPTCADGRIQSGEVVRIELLFHDRLAFRDGIGNLAETAEV